jgi:hypothetical protein
VGVDVDQSLGFRLADRLANEIERRAEEIAGAMRRAAAIRR